jgi:hypothetical protein
MIAGSIDDLGRPYVRVDAPGGYSVIFHIDTGVNRKLVMNRNALNLLGPFNSTVLKGPVEEVELADFSKIEVLKGVVQLLWFGEIEQIDVLVTTQVPKRPPHPDEPAGLIGTGFLHDCRLLIDFPKKLVEIHRDG